MPRFRLKHPLILASASPVRQKQLRDIQVPFEVIVSSFDEEQAKNTIKHLSVLEQALALARGKARVVSEQYPDALVLAADQIAEWDGNAIFKPIDQADNISMLNKMRGQTHYQHTAACLYKNGVLVYELAVSSELTLRELTEDEVISYVEADKPQGCCGGYKLESLGRHLFSEIKGCYDSILGLPLVPLLSFMYRHNYLSLA